MRRCISCGKTKPLDNFAGVGLGFMRACMDCTDPYMNRRANRYHDPRLALLARKITHAEYNQRKRTEAKMARRGVIPSPTNDN